MDADAGRTPLESALRKVQWRIIPLLAAGYLVAYMDRVNISFAAEPMNRDLHFTAHVYGLGAGLFFISYALCEIPSNGLLLKFGARRWLARIMLTWGALAVGMMFVRGRPSFYAMRLVLGAAEAGYFPGVIYYLSQWFPSQQRARAISWFYIAFPLSSTVMGAVAGSLLQLNGVWGLRGWQWLFVIEGLPAIGLSVLFWFGLPERVSTATWISEPERGALEAALTDGRLQICEESSWDLLWSVLREPRVWVFGMFGFCMLGSSYALSFFLPAVMHELTGWTPAGVGYLIALSGILGAVAMVACASHSDRTQERRWHVLAPVLIMAALSLLAGAHLRGIAVAWMLPMLLIPYAAMQGPMLALLTELCNGKAAALAVATFNMCGIFGGFAGPYWTGWMRELTGGYAVPIGGLCVPWLAAAACIVWLTRPRAEKVITVDEKTMNVEPELAK